MKHEEAQLKFIEAWGTLGSSWGINRTMAQIHALMLLATDAMSTEEIMEALNISRGNANMNIRSLMDWKLLHKKLIPGNRKDYFVAEKDIWNVARIIAKERKKRELEPVRELLNDIEANYDSDTSKESEELIIRVKEINSFTAELDGMMNKVIASDQKWFYKILVKMMSK